jgi:hypothetical protein
VAASEFRLMMADGGSGLQRGVESRQHHRARLGDLSVHELARHFAREHDRKEQGVGGSGRT